MAARALRRNEETLAALLQRTGLSRPAARCLACLVRGGEWTSGRLAEAAGVSLPGVSQGVRELVAARLVRRRFERTGGKGRPAHVYALEASPDEVLARVETERRAWLTQELAALDELRSLIRKVAP